MVGGQDRVAGIAEGVGGAEVELEARLLLRRHKRGGAHVDGRSADARRRSTVADKRRADARRSRTGVVRLDAEVLVVRLVVRLDVALLREGDGALSAHAASSDMARPIPEDVTLADHQ